MSPCSRFSRPLLSTFHMTMHCSPLGRLFNPACIPHRESVPCKHRRNFVLTTLTFPHSAHHWCTCISTGHSYRAVHSRLCQSPIQDILAIGERHPRCHIQPPPLETFPRLHVRVYFTRLPRAYNLITLPDQAVRSFSVLPSGRYSFI